MNLSHNSKSAITNNSDCLVLPIASSSQLSPSLSAIDKASGGYIKALIKSKDISTGRGKSTVLFKVPGIKAKRVLVLGVGNKKTLAPNELQSLYKTLLSAVEKTGAENVASYVHECELGYKLNKHISIAAETTLNAQYRFESQKSKKTPKSSVKALTFSFEKLGAKDKREVAAAIKNAKTLAKGMSLCKDLGNLPGNVCTPEYLAKEAQKMASAAKVSVKVMDEKACMRMGMGAFYSVAKGSDLSGKMIVINYQGGKKDQKPHVLVGKGITFDTGGISLKPGGAMDEMKYDMCGAASVLGAMSTIIAQKPALNVIAIIAAAENMPSGGASKPGDIVTTMSGLTVEILNTDAEGRLVLCDALTYAERFKPASVIDVATLTGACVVALGSHATALYSNNDKLAKKIEEAGIESWDRVWPMPLWPEYDIQLKSRFADLANIGGPKAGSITAACFLANFAKKYPWAHLDIAGTAWFGPGPSKGATGRPVPLLVEYINSQSK